MFAVYVTTRVDGVDCHRIVLVGSLEDALTEARRLSDERVFVMEIS